MRKLIPRLPFRPRLKPQALIEGAQDAAGRASDVAAASVRALGEGRGKAPVAAPALILATGAGVAFWWWTQWARGRAESEAAKTAD